MRWIVQENLNSKRNYLDLIDVLERLKVDYRIVRVLSDLSLQILETETKLPILNSEDILTTFTSDTDIMVYGSKALASIAKDRRYTGSFMSDNFEFEVLQDKYKNYLLNSNFIIGDLFSLDPLWNTFFIRPTGNTKLFTGMKISLNEFRDLQNREFVKKNSQYRGQNLLVSEVKDILTEYRFFVVSGQVISGSSYMFNGVFNTTKFVPEDVWAFAQKMVDLYAPANAFVIDIAVVKEGMKIVELNNINSSGFYNCDIEKIVVALNSVWD